MKVKQNNLNDLMFDSKDFSSISLGEINVLDKDTIHINDVDPKNIPEHLSIELEDQKKEI